MPQVYATRRAAAHARPPESIVSHEWGLALGRSDELEVAGSEVEDLLHAGSGVDHRDENRVVTPPFEGCAVNGGRNRLDPEGRAASG